MIEPAPDSPDLTYDQAWLYCLTLTHNNHKDWRIPTWHESQNYYKHIHILSWVEEDARLQYNTEYDPNAFVVTPVRTL